MLGLSVIILGGIAGWYQYQRAHFVQTTYAYVSAPLVWIKSPTTGIVQSVSVVPGQHVSAGQKVATILSGRSTTHSVTATLGGQVGLVGFRSGTELSAHQDALAIVNLSRAHIVAMVPESQISRLHTGQRAQVRYAADSHQVYWGTITHIGKATLSTTAPYISTGTFSKQRQWVPISIGLNGFPRFLRAGESASVKVTI